MDLSDVNHEKLIKALEKSAKESTSVWDEMLTRGKASPHEPAVHTIDPNEYLTMKDMERLMETVKEPSPDDFVRGVSIDDLNISTATGPAATIKTRGFRGSKASMGFVVNTKKFKEEKVKNGFFRLMELEMDTKVKRFEVHYDGLGIEDPNFIVASIPEWFKEADAKLLAEGIYNTIVEVHKAKDKLL